MASDRSSFQKISNLMTLHGAVSPQHLLARPTWTCRSLRLGLVSLPSFALRATARTPILVSHFTPLTSFLTYLCTALSQLHTRDAISTVALPTASASLPSAGFHLPARPYFHFHTNHFHHLSFNEFIHTNPTFSIYSYKQISNHL